MCHHADNIDIPVPDFTFEDYPETHYANGSYWAIKQLLAFKGYMIGAAAMPLVVNRHTHWVISSQQDGVIGPTECLCGTFLALGLANTSCPNS